MEGFSLKEFRRAFKPSGQRFKVSGEVLNEYKNKVPELLLTLWLTDGFGKYNNGLIELVDPVEFEKYLWMWLGGEYENYVPIAITGFGELFYYRRHNDNNEDVCIVDIYCGESAPVEYNLEQFFDKFLTNKNDRESWLNERLFKRAIRKYGKLADNEVFMIMTNTTNGRPSKIEELKKGDLRGYQEFLLEATL